LEKRMTARDEDTVRSLVVEAVTLLEERSMLPVKAARQMTYLLADADETDRHVALWLCGAVQLLRDHGWEVEEVVTALLAVELLWADGLVDRGLPVADREPVAL
jgi:hypothetical protein